MISKNPAKAHSDPQPGLRPQGRLIERLNSEAIRIVRLPEVSDGFRARGVESSPLGSDDFAAFVKREVEKWAKMVRATGMTIN